MRQKHPRLPNNPKCPKCGTIIDGADCTTHEGAIMEPGDVTVCFYCFSVAIYTEELTFETIPLTDLNPKLKEHVEKVIKGLKYARTMMRHLNG